MKKYLIKKNLYYYMTFYVIMKINFFIMKKIKLDNKSWWRESNDIPYDHEKERMTK